jgi:selenocysteine-specific elongation factor
VLDPFPPRRGRRTPARLAQLAALAVPTTAEALNRLLAVAPEWTDETLFMRAQNVPAPDKASLIATVQAVAAGGLLLSRPAFDRMCADVLATLATCHRLSPEIPGLQAEKLRLSIACRLPVAGFAGVLDVLLRDHRLARDGSWLRLPEHRIALSPEDEKRWRAARPLIADQRFRPPRIRDLAVALKTPEAAMRTTFKRLMRMGQVIEIAPDQFFLRETVTEMATIAAQAVDADGLLTAASFRDRLDNGRKVAILILEFFDKVGVTVRIGDARRVRMDRLTMFSQMDKIN